MINSINSVNLKSQIGLKNTSFGKKIKEEQNNTQQTKSRTFKMPGRNFFYAAMLAAGLPLTANAQDSTRTQDLKELDSMVYKQNTISLNEEQTPELKNGRTTYIGEDEKQVKVIFKDGGHIDCYGTSDDGETIFIKGKGLKLKNKGVNKVVILDSEHIDYKDNDKDKYNETIFINTHNSRAKLKGTKDNFEAQSSSNLDVKVKSAKSDEMFSSISIGEGHGNDVKLKTKNTAYIYNSSSDSNFDIQAGSTAIYNYNDANFNEFKTNIKKSPATVHVSLDGEHNQVRMKGNNSNIKNNIVINGDYNVVDAADNSKILDNANKNIIIGGKLNEVELLGEDALYISDGYSDIKTTPGNKVIWESEHGVHEPIPNND